MFPHAFVLATASVFSVVFVSAIVTLIYLCIIALTVMIALIVTAIFYIVYEFFWMPLYERSRHDLEEGEEEEEEEEETAVASQPNDITEWHDHAAFYQAAVLHNLRVLEMLDAVIEILEERKEQRKQRKRQRALEKKMPPPINYGSHGIEIRGRDCAICLEDYETGQLCQVFPSCKHTFHSKCMKTWLRKSLTCPICRNCVLDL